MMTKTEHPRDFKPLFLYAKMTGTARLGRWTGVPLLSLLLVTST